MVLTDLLGGTAVLTAFLAGAVALFAPCCISVLLPVYFASSFRRRTALLSMTGVFGLGVGTVILPIALGAAAVSRLINGQHFVVFLVGGILMLGMGLAMAAGRSVTLPMVNVPMRPGHGAGSVFALGVFSGVASACCAPVLAGVIGLSGVASSFAIALLIGTAYVFGMVLPLLGIALLWDRFDWGSSALLRGRAIQVRIGPRRLAVHTTSLVGGLVLVAMGTLVVALAFRGPQMAGSGWQASLSSWLQHIAHLAFRGLSIVPGWLSAVLILAGLALLVRQAIRQGWAPSADPDLTAPPQEARTVHDAPAPSLRPRATR